ncbi:hypothetical protein [Peribacillus butanolivorans]|uniref:hypothetical protein n=1 Tax=Peribacillus butanolivorans TaxID=421767 RepID=UPI0013C2C00D|nr:hypothetical protein [Peribacillus butanolivorans]QNU04632.1 hypothetical protein GM240_12165 [Peribacillus butanolivorans]
MFQLNGLNQQTNTTIDNEPIPQNIYEKLSYEVISLISKVEEWWNLDKIVRIIKKKEKTRY